MLKLYLDESGDLKDPQHTATAVGGAIGYGPQWDLFEQEWVRVLNKFYVGEFHMKYLAHLKKEFEDWTEQQRMKFFGLLAPIMDARIIKPIGAVIPREQFRALSDKQKEVWRNPYLICFEHSIRWALDTAERLCPDEHNIQIIYDEKSGKGATEFEAAVTDVYKRCKKCSAPLKSSHLG